MISLLRNLRWLFFSLAFFFCHHSLTHSPRKVLEMNSDTWFPERLISDRWVSSLFSIRLNWKKKKGNMLIYLLIFITPGEAKMRTFTEASRRPDPDILDETVTHFHNFPSPPFFFSFFLPLLYPTPFLQHVPNWSGRTKISISFWFERETECCGGEPLKSGIFPARLEKPDPHP